MSKEVFDQIVKEYGNDFAMTEFRKSIAEVSQYENKIKRQSTLKWIREEKKTRSSENTDLVKEKRKSKKLKSKKAKRNKNKKKWESTIESFAKSLQNKTIKSETWFKSLYIEHGIETSEDKYNTVFFKTYIPDIVNKKHKYIIEIDGSIHSTESQIEKDKKKDKFYSSKGYTVFRIKYLDVLNYIECIDKLIKMKRITPTDEYIRFVKRNKVINNC